MQLEKTLLKNAIGIKDGLGLDEIEIDFTKLPAGLIAISGPNGSGKSTFLDNTQPWLCIPSKPKHSLNQAFFEVGERDNIYSEVAGIEGKVRSRIIVDVEKRKTEAYLYSDNGSGWVPIGDAKGKIDPYKAEATKLFGSQSLFFQSAFRGQKATLFSACTKGDLKEMFEDLLGNLKEIKEYSDKAKGVKEALLKKEDSLQLQMDMLKIDTENGETKAEDKCQVEYRIKELAVAKKDNEDKIKALDKEIKSVEIVEEKQKGIKEALDKLNVDKKTREEKILSLKKSLAGKTLDCEHKLSDKKNKFERTKKITENADTIRAKVKEEEEASKTLGTLKSQQAGIEASLKEARKSMEYFIDLELKKTEKVSEIESAEKTLKYNINKVTGEIERARKGAAQLESVPCKGTDHPKTCQYVSGAIAAEKLLPDLRKQLQEAEDKKLGIENLKIGLKHIEDELKGKGDALNVLNKHESDLKGLQEKIASQEKEIEEIKKYTKLLSELEVAEQTIEEVLAEINAIEEESVQVLKAIEREIEGLSKEVKTISDVIFKKEMGMQTGLPEKLRGLNKDNADKVGFLLLVEGRLQQNHIELGSINNVLEKAGEASKKIEKIKKTISSLDAEIAEWLQLEVACGRERGVIPLEIDSSAPAISAIANDLLTQCFGPRFTIKINTTKLSADKKRTLEDFNIIVIDSERMQEKSLLSVSGGEEVYLNTAIMLAIVLFNKASRVSTLWIDETDGALSKDNKKYFMQMLQRVLKVGDFHRILFISHTPELWDMADARIKFGDGRVEVVQ